METETDSCTVHIRHSHTNIVSIEKNNEIIYQADAGRASEAQAEDEVPAIHRYTLKELLQYVREVPVSEIDFIREAFSMNMDLLEEGIQSDRTTITRRTSEGEWAQDYLPRMLKAPPCCVTAPSRHLGAGT